MFPPDISRESTLLLLVRHSPIDSSSSVHRGSFRIRGHERQLTAAINPLGRLEQETATVDHGR